MSSRYKRIFTFLSVFSVVFIVYVIYLDYRVTTRFEGRLWSLPAKVYARPMELYVGKKLSARELLYELKRLNYRKTNHIPDNAGEFHQWYKNFEIRVRAFTYWDGQEKEKRIRVDIEDGEVIRLNDLYSSKSLDIVRMDPVYITGIFPGHGEDRRLLKLNQIPEIVLKSLIAVEDRRFYEHNGVDPRSILRAFIANLEAGATVQGGSTITQQLVKNLFLSPSRSLWRKMNEAMMALLLELHYEKDQILETYFNEVFFGQDQNRAIHGFGLASLYYFDKELKNLSLDEVTLLIAMVKGASYYNPIKKPERVKQRREVVLKLLLENGLITERQLDIHLNRPVRVKQHLKRKRYPAFLDLVKRQLKESYSAEDLNSEGLRIFTTFDPYIQEQVESTIIQTVPDLDYKKHNLQAAAIVASPVDGDVLAVVGDKQPSYAGFNRVLDAKRPIGSLIKPVIYLAALRRPEKYTLASLLDDTRLRLQGEDEKLWEPGNYDKKFHGDVILYDALLKSYNIPAVRVGLDVGLSSIIQTINDLGLDKDLPPYPSLTLGAVDMSPYEVASIYQTFAANGFHSPLRSVFAVMDKDGHLLERYKLQVDKNIETEPLLILNYVMKNITESGTAKRLANELKLKAAGKTGTSDDLKDSWFAGFTGDRIAVVWLGYDDNTSSGLTGSSGAMRVWSKIMQGVARLSYELPESSDIEVEWIDRENGLRTHSECESAIQLPFIKDSIPLEKSACY